LNIFFDHIEKDEESTSAVYQKAQLMLPSFLFRIMAQKLNWTIDKDLRKHEIDVKQISPYLESH